MAEIHNAETIKRILDDAGIQTSHDEAPKQLASKVVPVLISNPDYKATILGSLVETTSDTSNIFIPANGKRSFITGIQMSWMYDAANTGTSLNVQGRLPQSPGTPTTLILGIRKLASVAGFRDISVVYNPPIEVLSGAPVLLQHVFGAGAGQQSAIITGFTIPPI